MIVDNLLVVAMLVFGLMTIGIVLTVLEFKKLSRQEQENQENDRSH